MNEVNALAGLIRKCIKWFFYFILFIIVMNLIVAACIGLSAPSEPPCAKGSWNKAHAIFTCEQYK